MFATVVLLRHKGVRLEIPNNGTPDSFPPEVVKRGVLEFGRPMHKKGKGLMLRDAMAAPGMAVQAMLYNPQIVALGDSDFVLRGFEYIESDDAVVMQEWRLFPMR